MADNGYREEQGFEAKDLKLMMKTVKIDYAKFVKLIIDTACDKLFVPLQFHVAEHPTMW